MKFNKYYLSALSAFIMWGFFSLVLKPLADYPSLDILFYRVFFAVVLLLGVNVLFRRGELQNDYNQFLQMKKGQRRRSVAMVVLGGFLLVINWFLFIYAVNHVSLSSAYFAYLLCPILTTILAYLLLKEKLTVKQWLAVSLSLVSCAILSFGDVTDLVFSFVIALSFAFYLIIQRKANKFDRFIVLTVQMLIAAIVIAPFFPEYSGPLPSGFFFYGMVMAIAVFFTVIPLYLNLYALKGMSSAAVGILMYINPLINFLLAILYFNEDITELEIISYSLILVSVLIFNLPMKNTRPLSPPETIQKD